MDQETNVLDATEDAAVEANDDTVDELLIEEISIDGMCGVY
jgi:mycofactocin precursor